MLIAYDDFAKQNVEPYLQAIQKINIPKMVYIYHIISLSYIIYYINQFNSFHHSIVYVIIIII